MRRMAISISESLRFGKSERPAVRRVRVSGGSKHHALRPGAFINRRILTMVFVISERRVVSTLVTNTPLVTTMPLISRH